MSVTVIKVENLSKQYRLGDIGTGSIAHDINRWWYKIRGEEDPYLQIGEENDRTIKSSSEYVWALRNIDFEIRQGEAVGIIGRNGAGKSTLLKILSRTTSPTYGQIKIRGRIASLLEVGTGFHPELSGRENIFLNGAILGMTKQEIRSKFDEIVDFAGIERYIDTPVKRYSSGMYVRLAFAVAAHLEPEILIVDEVLAVGDAEFQKKCLGKMQDVSGKDGRTILFVSHNMTAIKSLCSRAIWIDKGLLTKMGDTEKVIDQYLIGYIESTNFRKLDLTNSSLYANEKIKFIKVAVESQNDIIRVNESFFIYFQFESLLENLGLNMSLVLYTKDDTCVLNTGSGVVEGVKGIYEAKCIVPANFLNDEFYRVRILIIKDRAEPLIDIENVISFEINDIQREGNWYGKWLGVVRPEFTWEIGKKI